jgi:uncharacterized protein (TIGR02118 family)
MVKAMIFLSRREGMSLDQFRHWWLNEHRAMAEQLPGLRKHAFNLLAEGPFDAVVEQWFESHETMLSSYDTDIGRRVAADSLAHVSARQRVIVEEYCFALTD